MAEGEGFEPSIGLGPMPPFQGGTFNHSATLPWMGFAQVSSKPGLTKGLRRQARPFGQRDLEL